MSKRKSTEELANAAREFLEESCPPERYSKESYQETLEILIGMLGDNLALVKSEIRQEELEQEKGEG